MREVPEGADPALMPVMIRCRAPGCEDLAIPSTLACVDHIQPDDLVRYAEEYAVASIIYYGGHPGEFMSDARFDGLCDWLLKNKAWETVPWIEREMLLAGSGYDLSKFPVELHKVALAWLG